MQRVAALPPGLDAQDPERAAAVVVDRRVDRERGRRTARSACGPPVARRSGYLNIDVRRSTAASHGMARLLCSATPRACASRAVHRRTGSGTATRPLGRRRQATATRSAILPAIAQPPARVGCERRVSVRDAPPPRTSAAAVPGAHDRPRLLDPLPAGTSRVTATANDRDVQPATTASAAIGPKPVATSRHVPIPQRRRRDTNHRRQRRSTTAPPPSPRRSAPEHQPRRVRGPRSARPPLRPRPIPVRPPSRASPSPATAAAASRPGSPVLAHLVVATSRTAPPYAPDATLPKHPPAPCN